VATDAGSSSNGQSEGFILIRNRTVMGKLERLVADVLWRSGFRYLGAGGVLGKVLEWTYGQELMRQYRPYHGIFRHRREDGEMEGIVFRDAPLVMVAYGLKKNVLAGANCAVALRNVELQALTMGLGTCWAGFLVAAAARSGKIGRFLDMAPNTRVGGALMIGHPDERFQLTIPRKPRAVRWI
jgi:nitroreductase